MCVWAYLRHYINLRIIYSLFPYDVPLVSWLLGVPAANEFATVGPYTLDFSIQQYKCWISQPITFSLLAVLQAVNAFWFFLICRILARIVLKGVQKDDRSDDEEEEEEEVVVEEVAETQKTNGHAVKPQVVVNGQPISSPNENGAPVKRLETANGSVQKVETANGSVTVTKRRK